MDAVKIYESWVRGLAVSRLAINKCVADAHQFSSGCIASPNPVLQLLGTALNDDAQALEDAFSKMEEKMLTILTLGKEGLDDIADSN